MSPQQPPPFRESCTRFCRENLCTILIWIMSAIATLAIGGSRIYISEARALSVTLEQIKIDVAVIKTRQQLGPGATLAASDESPP